MGAPGPFGYGHQHEDKLGVTLTAYGKALLVEGGDRALTTAALARAANCSKESLYKWFGDRDGLLTATVRWQASKVRMPKLPEDRLTRESLEAGWQIARALLARPAVAHWQACTT